MLRLRRVSHWAVPIFACIISWLGFGKTVENGVLSPRWVNGFSNCVRVVGGRLEMVDGAGLRRGLRWTVQRLGEGAVVFGPDMVVFRQSMGGR